MRELTGGNSGPLGDGPGKTRKSVSDPLAKENVVRIGSHPAGFGIYLFDYKAEFRADCGEGRQFGVMADEVEAIVPEAVEIQANGYRAVRYDLLGITQH